MNKNTAVSAKNAEIIFLNREHKDFYYLALEKAGRYDVYLQALLYCLGIDKDTRRHICAIYDFDERAVKPDCLQEAWITSGNARVIRMAFNLYCNGAPSVDQNAKKTDIIREYECYTPEDLFCCGYARYFWQAIRLRYPEYCA